MKARMPALGTLNPSGNPTQTQQPPLPICRIDEQLSIRWGTYHDVTTGGSTGSPTYSCAAGYDMVTGIGTPLANLLLPALAYAPAAGTPDLAAAYDTGTSNTDNITSLNNHNSLDRTSVHGSQHDCRRDGYDLRRRDGDRQRHGKRLEYDGHQLGQLYAHRRHRTRSPRGRRSPAWRSRRPLRRLR